MRTKTERSILKKGLRSVLKLVSSEGATKDQTVQVETVPLNNFQVTPATYSKSIVLVQEPFYIEI
jgi:hypothetical protein